MPGSAPMKREDGVRNLRRHNELSGRLLRLDSQSLSIEVEERRVDMPLHRVLKIEKKVKDTVLDGALLLGTIRRGVREVVVCARNIERPRTCPEDIYIGFGVGALAGAALDSQISGGRAICTRVRCGKADR